MKEVFGANAKSALVLLRAARADFRKQQELDTSGIEKGAHKMKEAETLIIESSVLAASGGWNAARATADHASELLRQVIAADLPAEIRQKAEKGLVFVKEVMEGASRAQQAPPLN